MKISYDFDGVLSKSEWQIDAMRHLEMNHPVYIISARSNPNPLIRLGEKLGIPKSRIFATGSNKRKVEKVLELGIDIHYDNNPKVIEDLGSKGKLV